MMNKTKIAWFVIIAIWSFSSNAYSQFSGYLSMTSGWNQNPLYNYEKIGDQVKQTYFELNYTSEFESSLLNLHYVSGLMIFNKFQPRNYYEHSFGGIYKIKFSNKKLINETDNQSINQIESEEDSLKINESLTEEKDESTDDEEADSLANEETEMSDVDSLSQAEEEIPEVEVIEDSTDTYFDIGLKFSARHDKSEFKEFDNFGSQLHSSLRTTIFKMFTTRLTNNLFYRGYNYLSELSNITNIVNLQLGNKFNKDFNYGVNLSAGIKYYTADVYDTSKFEQVRSFTVKDTGKGKLGGKIVVYSTKPILIAQTNKTFQFTAGCYLSTVWESGNVFANLIYRYNPQTKTRYLAQYANTTILSEDIYNDFFSHQGFESTIIITQKLIWNINLSLNLEFQQKKFGVPALNLIGNEIDGKRSDLRYSAEFYLSRYFEVFSGIGLDLVFAGGYLRNQSNDSYNDFSSYNFSTGVGIGF